MRSCRLRGVDVLIWDEADLQALESAGSEALQSFPQLVVVHGGPGSGRTRFLSTVADQFLAQARSHGAQARRWAAQGSLGTAAPFQGLRDLGVLLPALGEGPTALEVEQELREAIDEALDVGPLLIVIDDLQWLDPESVDALARVLGSAVAERLLVVVTVGHFEPFQHLRWQALSTSSPLVRHVELHALSLESATLVARELRSDVRDGLIQRVWKHTRGNPLFFTSLLRRIDPLDLERMVQLPAPTEYARAIEVRLSTLGAEPVRLARATAVIGTGWTSLAEAAYLADLTDAAAALDVLAREYILEQRSSDLGTEIRIVHAVIQASIYQFIPTTDRIALHARAADLAADEPTELRHLFAAATTYDDQLARRLEEAADRARADRRHRLAAQYLDWASRVTASGMLRSTRYLDALYEWILAGNVEYVRDQLPEVHRARDRNGAALVLGALLVLDNNWTDALRILRPISGAEVATLRAYRIEVLLAWSSMTAGEASDTTDTHLARAEALPIRDDGLAGLFSITSAMLDRRQDRVRQTEERLRKLPRREAAVPVEDTYWLAWRGFAAALHGRASEAITPLREVDARIATGLSDVGDGLAQAFLGLAHWLSGAAEVAAIHFRNAETQLRPRPNPLTSSLIAIGQTTSGSNERATALLESARTTLRDMPWDEGVNVLLTASVFHLHAYGSERERAALLPRHRRDFGSKADQPDGAIGSIWKAQAALAHIWAGEPEPALALAASIRQTPELDWSRGVATWLEALVAERRGDIAGAVDLLAGIRRADTASLPLYAAHIAADHARLAAATGDTETATTQARRAHELYTSMNAVPYLSSESVIAPESLSPSTSSEHTPHALDASPASGSSGAPLSATTTSSPSVFSALTERERAVAALVVTGMSYAQIARELFITRSTVGYHLTRIYAKTATATRHELSELARRR
jgi:DNA-binding CsgD family transcriptional regulator